MNDDAIKNHAKLSTGHRTDFFLKINLPTFNLKQLCLENSTWLLLEKKASIFETTQNYIDRNKMGRFLPQNERHVKTYSDENISSSTHLLQISSVGDSNNFLLEEIRLSVKGYQLPLYEYHLMIPSNSVRSLDKHGFKGMYSPKDTPYLNSPLEIILSNS